MVSIRIPALFGLSSSSTVKLSFDSVVFFSAKFSKLRFGFALGVIGLVGTAGLAGLLGLAGAAAVGVTGFAGDFGAAGVAGDGEVFASSGWGDSGVSLMMVMNSYVLESVKRADYSGVLSLMMS